MSALKLFVPEQHPTDDLKPSANLIAYKSI